MSELRGLLACLESRSRLTEDDVCRHCLTSADVACAMDGRSAAELALLAAEGLMDEIASGGSLTAPVRKTQAAWRVGIEAARWTADWSLLPERRRRAVRRQARLLVDLARLAGWIRVDADHAWRLTPRGRDVLPGFAFVGSEAPASVAA